LCCQSGGEGFNALETLGQFSDGIAGGINELKGSGISALAEQGEAVEKYVGPLGYGIAVYSVGAAFKKDHYQFGLMPKKQVSMLRADGQAQKLVLKEVQSLEHL
jgi:hypothetical protein